MPKPGEYKTVQARVGYLYHALCVGLNGSR